VSDDIITIFRKGHELQPAVFAVHFKTHEIFICINFGKLRGTVGTEVIKYDGIIVFDACSFLILITFYDEGYDELIVNSFIIARLYTFGRTVEHRAASV